MSVPPPNLDTRELPYGWMQQYNWDYKQWFYVNTRENPPRSSWEHPLGPMPQGFASPLGPPPPDRGYSRSPYAVAPGYGAHPPQGYGGYQGYPSYGPPPPNYGPQGGYAGGPPYYGGYERRRSRSRSRSPERREYHGGERTVYVEERSHRKGPGVGTALLAGGAGLVGGALLMDAIEDHNEQEREIGFDQGYQDGWQDNQADPWGGDGW